MLPRATEAVVEPSKIRRYLLSASHPIGRYKAAVFFGLGYRADNWQRLRDDLKAHAVTGATRLGESLPHGQKYIVEGPLTGPSGRAVSLRSIWLVADENSPPRFITAYPE